MYPHVFPKRLWFCHCATLGVLSLALGDTMMPMAREVWSADRRGTSRVLGVTVHFGRCTGRWDKNGQVWTQRLSQDPLALSGFGGHVKTLWGDRPQAFVINYYFIYSLLIQYLTGIFGQQNLSFSIICLFILFKGAKATWGVISFPYWFLIRYRESPLFL